MQKVVLEPEVVDVNLESRLVRLSGKTGSSKTFARPRKSFPTILQDFSVAIRNFFGINVVDLVFLSVLL